jgi:hypothetical protein
MILSGTAGRALLLALDWKPRLLTPGLYLAGALLAGARGRVDARLLVGASFLFGVLLLAAAAAPTLPLQMAALVPLGAVSVTFAAGINSLLQLTASPPMRGRVMALYSVVFLGSTPIGAPITGWLAGAAGPRSTLVMAGVAALLGGIWLKLALVAKDSADVGETVEQPVHVDARVVDRKRRSRRRGDTEPAHQRLRAMVPGANAHTRPAENLANVVRMRAGERERDERAPLGRVERPVDRQLRDL